MPPAGTLEIDASLNSGNLDAGINRSKQKLKELGDTANSVDVETGKLGKTLGGIGRLAAVGATAAAGFFGVVAAKAPATAASRARINVSVGKIIRGTGEKIAPAFSKVADAVEFVEQRLAEDRSLKTIFEETKTGFVERSRTFADKRPGVADFFQNLFSPFLKNRKAREDRNEADL